MSLELRQERRVIFVETKKIGKSHMRTLDLLCRNIRARKVRQLELIS